VWAVVVGNIGGRAREGGERVGERSRARDEGKCPRLRFPFEA
jgi:hypothetical protein